MSALLKKMLHQVDFETPKRLEQNLTPKLELPTIRPLANLLPYRRFEEENNLFINQNSHGFILETTPLLGADEQTCQILASLITQGLPAGCVVQFLQWSSPRIQPLFERWQTLRSSRGETYARLAKRRTDFLMPGAFRSLIPGSHYYLRNYRTFIVVGFSGAPDDFQKISLVALQKSIINTLRSVHCEAFLLEPNSFLSFLDELVNPTLSVQPYLPVWNEYDPLNLQITSPESALTVYPHELHFNRNEMIGRVFSARQLPVYWAQWQMAQMIGDAFNEQLQIPCPTLTTLVVSIADQEKVQTKAAIKFARTAKQNQEGASRFLPILAHQEKDWRRAHEAILSGHKLVPTYYQVVAYSTPDQIDGAESSIKALYEAKGWKLFAERFLQLQSWLSALPFTLSEGLLPDMQSLGRFKTVLSSNAANLAPLQGEWRGSGTPRVLLTGRRGQPLFWDPFTNSEGNYNAAIVGKSGSGKSVFLQEICTGLLGSGARVFVIDKGRSFMRLCKLLDGTFIEFTQQAKLCLNPFSRIDPKDPSRLQEALTLLKPLLQIMAKPTGGTNDLENSLLEKGIQAAWSMHQQYTTISHIAKWLSEQEDERAQDLSVMLFPYTQFGSYGRFFEGACNVDLNNDLVVMELEELQNQPELQSVVLMVLMYQVMEAMYLGGRNRHIACIIDEAWDLLGNNPSSAQFIETGYRQARKYASCFMTGTQGINDYYKTPAAQAAFENSDWLIALAQKKESIKALKNSGRLDCDAAMEQALASVHTRQDVYSEALIYGPNGYAIGRLLLDDFSLGLYTSKAEDYARIEQLLKQGLTVAEAIEQHMHAKKRGKL